MNPTATGANPHLLYQHARVAKGRGRLLRVVLLPRGAGAHARQAGRRLHVWGQHRRRTHRRHSGGGSGGTGGSRGRRGQGTPGGAHPTPGWPAGTPRAAPARPTRCACPVWGRVARQTESLKAILILCSKGGSLLPHSWHPPPSVLRAHGQQAAVTQLGVTLPPPPAEALIMTGKPMSRATAMAWSASSVTPAHPGMVLTCRKGKQAGGGGGCGQVLGVWASRASSRVPACSSLAGLAPSQQSARSRRHARLPACHPADPSSPTSTHRGRRSKLLALHLVPHFLDSKGRRPHPGGAGRLHSLGKHRVLAQKAWTGFGGRG